MTLHTKTHLWRIASPIILLLLGLACSFLPGRQAGEEEVSPMATRTPFPTFTPTTLVEATLSIPPTSTPTPIPPPTEPPPEPAAEIPPTETPTPEPAPTEPPPTEPPPPPPTQPPPPTEPPPAEPQPGAHGVIGKISFRDGRNTYGVGEKVFVKIEVVNTNPGLTSFGILGLTPSTGSFQTSWSNDAFEAGRPFTHEDGLAFSTPGTHKLWLSVCFSSKEQCQGPDGDWERFEPGLDVIVQ